MTVLSASELSAYIDVLLTACKRVRSGTSGNFGKTTAIRMLLLAGFVELLSKWRAATKYWTFPIDHIDSDDENERDTDFKLSVTFDERIPENLQRMVEASARWFFPPILVKNGVAGIVSTPARKSLAQPFPPVADAEYGPYAQIM